MGRFILCVWLLSAFHAHADLVLKQGQVRAMPPGQPNTAAFMTLQNTGDKTVTLVTATTEIAAKSEFHTHTKNAQGVMSMGRIPSVSIAPGQTFEFKSGHEHVMIMGLKKPLTPGAHVVVTLQDAEGASYTYHLPVVSLVDHSSMHHHHHHQDQE